MNDSSGSNTTHYTNPLPNYAVSFWPALGVLFLFVIIAYVSYSCRRNSYGITVLSLHLATSGRSLATTTSTTTNDDGVSQSGLDEATLSAYPHFTYSQLKSHNKSDFNASACSICIADYKDDDLLRLLPDCGHLYHVKCVDPWLMLHPTCPICRNSPLPTPQALAVQLSTV